MAVERFFSVAQVDCWSSSSIASDILILLSGPPSCGKSSLLLQFAVNSAAAGDGDVVFICNHRKLHSNPPYLSQGVDPSSQVFERVHMKYVDDHEGIINYFSAFHLLDVFPVTIIIDDFADFFDERNCKERYKNSRGRDLAMARTLALCRNAISHANRTRPCRLLLSDTHLGDSPRLLYLYKRWISSIYTLQSSLSGDTVGSFLLRNIYQSGIENPLRGRAAKYSIALQYLILEGITTCDL